MNIKKARKINTVLFTLFITSIIGAVILEDSAFQLIGHFFIIAIVLLSIINGVVNNKCPECKKYRRKHPGKYCKFCGKEFDFDKEY